MQIAFDLISYCMLPGYICQSGYKSNLTHKIIIRFYDKTDFVMKNLSCNVVTMYSDEVVKVKGCLEFQQLVQHVVRCIFRRHFVIGPLVLMISVPAHTCGGYYISGEKKLDVVKNNFR